MSYKTASQQRSTARSTKSSEASVAASPSGGYNLYNVTASTVINEITITPGQVQTSSVPLGITITSISVTNSSYVPLSPPTSTVNTAGGYISILGNGFTPSSLTYIQGTLITATTYVSTNQINAQVPALNVSQVTTQQIYVANSSTNSAGILITGYQYGVVPYWTGSTTSAIASTNINFSLAALSDSTMTYAIISGSLPGGLTLNTSTGVITGSYSLGVNSSTTVTISATNLQNQYNTQTFNITIIVQDPYYNYTSLLLNGETNTSTYIADASTNNFALTVSGAANPNRFSPLWGNGYYGNSFDGSSTGYLQSPLTNIPTSLWYGTAFTLEYWIYPLAFGGTTNSSNYSNVIGWGNPSNSGESFDFGPNSSGTIIMYYYNGSQIYYATSATIPKNAWTHLALDGNNGVMTIYVNGVSVGSTTKTGTPVVGDYFLLGAMTNTGRFNGYLSNVRVTNTRQYTSNFTPSQSPLTAVTGTQLLTCQSNSFIDNSINNNALTQAGAVKVVSNQPFGALPSGVQNYGSSLFDGSTGYLSSGARSAFAFGTGDFTIEFWMYVNSSAGNYETMYSLAHSAGSVIVRFGNSGSYNSLLQVSMTGSTASVVYSTSISQTTALNNWVHVAFTRASSTCRVFYNGIQQVLNTGTNPTTFPLSSFTDTTNVNTVTSSYIGGDGGTTYFPGYISNARVVNGTAVYTSNFTPPTTPLTAIANTALLTLQNKNGANNNTFYDDSVNNFPITRTGTPTQGTFTPFSQTGWSNYFDGSSGYLTFTSGGLGLGSNWTIECWINLTSISGSSMAILSNLANGPTAGGYIWAIGSASSMYFTYYNTSGSGPSTTGTFTFNLNTWYHVAVVGQGGTATFYVNGISQGGGSIATSMSNSYTNYIGGNANSSYLFRFPGYISNLRVVNGTAVYTSNFTPPTAPLTAITNTALLTCQSNRFLDNSTNAFTLTPSGTVQVQAFSPFAPGVSYSSANNGGSMYFSATGNYLYCANNVFNISSGTLQWTFETWVYPTNTNTYFFAIGNGAPYGNSMQCGWSSNNFNFYQGNGSSNPVSVVSASGTYYPYAWYHYAVSKDSSGNIRLFINGTQVNTQNYTSTVASGTTVVINGLSDSNGLGNNGGQWYLSGLRLVIGQTLYTSAFTPPTAPPTPTASTSLLLLGTNTGIQDATGKNDIITYGSAKTQANTVKYGTGAMYFDGSTSYAYLPPNNLYSFGSGDFTIEAWVNLGATSSTQPVCQSDIVGGSTNNKWFFSYTSSTLVFNTHSSGGFTNSIPWTPTIGTWYHVAVTRASGTMKMFINGVSGTVTTTGTPSGYSLSQNGISVGGMSTPYYLTGYIDDLRITNGVARYTANFTPLASAAPTQ